MVTVTSLSGLSRSSLTIPKITPSCTGLGDTLGVGKGGNVGAGDGEATGVVVGLGVGDTWRVGTGDSVGEGDVVGVGVVEAVFVAKDAALPYDVPALFDATMR